MSRLVQVDDRLDDSGSNFLPAFLLVMVLLVVLVLAFFWTNGYMGGPRVINMMPAAAPTQIVTPNTQTQGAPGTPGAAGMGGSGGNAGTAGSAGAAGAAGAAGSAGAAGAPGTNASTTP